MGLLLHWLTFRWQEHAPASTTAQGFSSSAGAPTTSRSF